MLSSPYSMLVFMWILFAVVHSGLASGTAMRLVGNRMEKYYRPVYSLIIIILLVQLVHYHFEASDTIMWRPHWLVKIVAAVMILSGLAAIAVSLWNHLLSYTGLGQLLGLEAEQGFEKDGLHQYTRHPLYTGVLFLLWGVFIGYPYKNNLISAICFTIYFMIGIFFLERKLVAAYGEEYKEYRRRVPILLRFKKN